MSLSVTDTCKRLGFIAISYRRSPSMSLTIATWEKMRQSLFLGGGEVP